MVIFPQGGGYCFFETLRDELGMADKFDAVSAWVRVSGLDLLWPELESMLDRGGSCRIIVGIDRDNTSIEALRALAILNAEREYAACYVRHDEASIIFHPKAYAFRADGRIRIYSGSNNLTGAGLALNDEFMLMGEHDGTSPVSSAFDAYLADRSDTSTGLTFALTEELCDRLEDEGYAAPERQLRGKQGRRAGKPSPKHPIFGRTNPVAFPMRGVVPQSKADQLDPQSFEFGDIEPSPVLAKADWNRVFLRLQLSRGTQSQLPKPVFLAVKERIGDTDPDTPFRFIERATGRERLVSPAAGGNTYKLEAGFLPKAELLLRLELIGGRVIADYLDSATAEGTAIRDHLFDGLERDPPQTVSTIADTDRSTLYRFD